MGAMRGALVGGIGLVTLYNLVSAGNAGLLAATSIPGKIAKYIVDPSVPLVPDRSASSGGISGRLDPSTLPGGTSGGKAPPLSLFNDSPLSGRLDPTGLPAPSKLPTVSGSLDG